MVSFRYLEKEIHEDLHQVHLLRHVREREQEQYIERKYLTIREERLYRDKESGILVMDVCENIGAYFVLSLYHQKEMQAA